MVRGPISMVIVGAILLVMMALVAGGPRVFEKVLPDSVLSWLDSLPFEMPSMMLSDSGTTLGGKSADADRNDPRSYLSDSSDGWKATGPITSVAGGDLAFVRDVIDGYSTRVTDAAPGAVEPLVEVEGCSFTAPSAEAYVGHADSRGEKTRIGVATYNDTHVAAAVQGLVNVYRRRGTIQQSSLSGLSYEVFDIAVTETDRPVYLVLEAGNSRPVFNIHLAPGARLERVVLIGGEQIGVANVDPAVPVEVMRYEASQACGFNPFYPLNPGALYYQSVASGVISAEEVTEYEAKFAGWMSDWDAAFRSAFGVGAMETFAGNIQGATIATVGPKPATPDQRAVWKTIKGAPVRLTLDQYVEYVGQGEGRDFDSVVKAVAKSFAWGDLKNLSDGVQF